MDSLLEFVKWNMSFGRKKRSDLSESVVLNVFGIVDISLLFEGLFTLFLEIEDTYMRRGLETDLRFKTYVSLLKSESSIPVYLTWFQPRWLPYGCLSVKLGLVHLTVDFWWSFSSKKSLWCCLRFQK